MSTNGGRFEDETVSKNSFRGFEGQRPTKAGAPAGNLRRIQSAQFDGVKSSQDYFSAVSTVKPTKVCFDFLSKCIGQLIFRQY